MAAIRDLKVVITGADDAFESIRRLNAELERIEARVGRIQGAMVARPGDTVVVVCPECFSQEKAAEIKAQWGVGFPDVKLALIHIPGAQLA